MRWMDIDLVLYLREGLKVRDAYRREEGSCQCHPAEIEEIIYEEAEGMSTVFSQERIDQLAEALSWGEGLGVETAGELLDSHELLRAEKHRNAELLVRLEQRLDTAKGIAARYEAFLAELAEAPPPIDYGCTGKGDDNYQLGRERMRWSIAQKAKKLLDEVRHDDEASPGSPLAVSRGCTCPVLDNNNGQGQLRGGEQYFWKAEDCPLHSGDLRSDQEEVEDGGYDRR